MKVSSGFKGEMKRVTWETCVLILVPGRSLGRSLILWAKEGESTAAWVEKNLPIMSSLHVGDLFFNKLLKAAMNGSFKLCHTTKYTTNTPTLLEEPLAVDNWKAV